MGINLFAWGGFLMIGIHGNFFDGMFGCGSCLFIFLL